MSPQYGELRPTSRWDLSASLGHPCKFQQVSHLGSVTARHSSSGHQPNLAALNRRRHLYLAGRPSRALAHISSYYALQLLLHLFNDLFSRTTWVSRHQKGKPFWILLEQEMMEWQCISWTICKSFAPRSRQKTAPVPHHSVFTGRMPFLPPSQQHQSTEDPILYNTIQYRFL